jgi:hypothetical protein
MLLLLLPPLQLLLAQPLQQQRQGVVRVAVWCTRCSLPLQQQLPQAAPCCRLLWGVRRVAPAALQQVLLVVVVVVHVLLLQQRQQLLLLCHLPPYQQQQQSQQQRTMG